MGHGGDKHLSNQFQQMGLEYISKKKEKNREKLEKTKIVLKSIRGGSQPHCFTFVVAESLSAPPCKLSPNLPPAGTWRHSEFVMHS